MQLFREEALCSAQERWLGEIFLARHATFAVWSALSLATAFLMLGFLVWGEYTKKERVVGYVVPDRGIFKIQVTQPSTVVSLTVRDGQQLHRGDEIARVSTERNNATGPTQMQVAHEIQERERSVKEETQTTQTLFDQQLQTAKVRLAQAVDELGQLSHSIELQRERVKLAETAYERHAKLAEEKFVSESILTDRRADLLDQRSRLTELMRVRVSMEREAANLTSDVAGIPLKRAAAIAALSRVSSELSAAAAETESKREEVIVAPQDGTVTALQISLGKQVSPSAPLMSFVPADAVLLIDLYVPSKAIGFIRPGSRVRLRYQAFPHQKFGSHEGRVERISRTAVPAAELTFSPPAAEAYYVVTVAPTRPYVMAYGRPEALQAGMQVEADIEVDRRTFLEWIFEPILAARGRV